MLILNHYSKSMIRPYVLIFILFLLYSCGNRGKNNAEQKKYEIKSPEVPAIITSPEERVEYVTKHFWDNFDFSDTTFLNHDDVLEQAFSNYIHLAGAMPLDKGRVAVQTTLRKALSSSAMFDKFTELYEKYLYDPNSPARNEELYIPILEFIVNSDKVEELDKIRPQSQLETALKNRVGHKAADITIRRADGKRTSLYATKADYTILYINNPDCSACAEITSRLVNSQVISKLFGYGIVKIFAVYPDEDIKAWRDHLPSMPAQWVNGYDESLDMRNKDTYDLRAIPSLYLLDGEKTVLIKDAADVVPIEQWFLSNGVLQ